VFTERRRGGGGIHVFTCVLVDTNAHQRKLYLMGEKHSMLCNPGRCDAVCL
jgi:hypothetical protein